ncbi:MAG: hypothetical protein MNPFHGCM_00049 [Gemmatimonadaceae bacterium]|nr:hypothetical protein [Gemmatimonadaceae bacterium]
MRTAFSLLTGLMLLAIVAPARAAEVRPERDSSKVADTTKTIVDVRNQGFLDAVVYVIRDGGYAQRLGTAIGNTTARFVLPAHLSGGLNSFKFVVHRIGGRNDSVSDEILASRGDVIELTIPPY